MDSFQFYLTEMGFISLILIILSLVITIYLIQGRSKSRPTWLLISFFGAVIANSITMLLANAWVFWGDMLMPAQDAWILLGGVALAQYAYHIPRYDQKREARLALVITGSVALFAAGYSIYYAAQYMFNYTPGLDESEAYYLLLPMMTLFIIGVFFRRAVRYASIPTGSQRRRIPRLRRLAAALVRPQNREVRTLRDYGLALSLGLLPGIAYFLKPLPMMPDWLPSYMLSIGSVLAVAALALVYINNSGEQTSFIGKILGISLVTFLLIFGALGSSLIDRAERQFSEEAFVQAAIAHDAILANEFSSLPASIVYVIAWPRAEMAPGGSGTTQDGESLEHALLYLRSGQEDFYMDGLLAENRILQSGIYPAIHPLFPLASSALERLPSAPTHTLIRYADFPYGSEWRYDSYLFDGNDRLYEIGLSHFENLNKTHEMVIYLTSWVVLSSLIIIFFFPAFYHLNLVQPLKRLLGGVKRVDQGDLDIHIPVQYEDEIGRLTHSFNNLVSSLHQSNQARDALNDELQKRLEELRLSEEKFFKAFHSSPLVMILQRENDANYLDVNAAFTEVTGHSREEAIGHKPGELSLYPTQEEANRVRQAFSEVGGRLRNFEFRFQRKSGETGTGLLSSEFFELQGARTMLGIVMDISERKKAEDQIRRLNVEMEQRVADRSRELSAFLDLAFLVSHGEDRDQIFLPALERIVEISDLQVVCVHSYSSDRQYLTLESQVGLQEHEADRMCLLLPMGGFAAWLGRPNEALLFSDLGAAAILPDEMRPARMHSCLVAQLMAHGEVLGVLSCYRQDVHVFSLEEISLLVAVAEHLGISLENQKLRQEIEQAAIATERRRLARDLHDSVTQSLYGLTLFTRSGQDALREGNQAKLAASLGQIEENASLALKEMRLLLYQMQPQGLAGGFLNGINARLDLVERRSGIQASCQIDERVSLSPAVEQTLFRIAMEALNNSLKHAQASQVHVLLEQVNGVLLMEVRDDGQGFEAGSPSEANFPGMGITNMRARAAELGGGLEIISSPGNGTRVRLLFDPSTHQTEGSER